ncbi:MAG: NAD(P)H-hydrate dehydratase [Candidatus Berkiella sp.]
MSALPFALYKGQDVKKLDALAIEHDKLSGYELMCRAGTASWQLLKAHWPEAKEVTIFCGKGNNGGDGYVLARLAKEQGMKVQVYELAGSSENSPQEAQQARQEWHAKGGTVALYQGQTLQGDLIVDALLGTGARAPLPENIRSTILAINQSGISVLAIDVPSGLHADTGENLGQVVKAQVTLTFIGLKVGLFLKDAVDCVGELVFDSLDISESLLEKVTPCAFRVDYEQALKSLKTRPRSSHKGNFGHVLVIGGGQLGYSGAPALAGEAAMRAGAGLVSAIVSPECLSLLSRAPKELMCYAPSDPKECTELYLRASVVVLGPGLAQNEWGKRFFQSALSLQKPMVVDADGLNWLAKSPQSGNWLLTPHPGEAARLLNQSIEQVQADRVQAALLLQQRYGGVIVLKGAGTVIVDEQGKVYINGGGIPALATAGSGDVLAGLIGGLLAQGLSLKQAALLGVSVHAEAAIIEQSLGERGMIASELLLHIRSLLNVFSAP